MDRISKLKFLLPCPFCGSKNLDVSYSNEVVGSGDIYPINVICKDCACSGPWVFDTKINAIEAWNIRSV